jgi:hypothetical protein
MSSRMKASSCADTVAPMAAAVVASQAPGGSGSGAGAGRAGGSRSSAPPPVSGGAEGPSVVRSSETSGASSGTDVPAQDMAVTQSSDVRLRRRATGMRIGGLRPARHACQRAGRVPRRPTVRRDGVLRDAVPFARAGR